MEMGMLKNEQCFAAIVTLDNAKLRIRFIFLNTIL